MCVGVSVCASKVFMCVCVCARICVRQSVFSCAKGYDKDTKGGKKRVSDRIKE